MTGVTEADHKAHQQLVLATVAAGDDAKKTKGATKEPKEAKPKSKRQNVS